VGTVQPPASGTYTFFTESDDGVRLWVNGQQLVNNWTDHSRTENSGVISLTGGVKYAIRMEFYERGGDAVARLLWSGPSTAKAVIPQTALFSRFGARINFQPAAAAVPAGYLPDTGSPFGLRSGGSASAGTPTTRRRRATATRPARPISGTTRSHTCRSPGTATRSGRLRSRTGRTRSGSSRAIPPTSTASIA